MCVCELGLRLCACACVCLLHHMARILRGFLPSLSIHLCFPPCPSALHVLALPTSWPRPFFIFYFFCLFRVDFMLNLPTLCERLLCA